MLIDKKATKILLKTFWDSSGWRFNCLDIKDVIKRGYLTQEDFEYAKSKGMMFDTVTISHDECLSRLKNAALKIDIKVLTSAFLYSLSTKQVFLRSAISSFSYAQRIENHKFEHHPDTRYSPMTYSCSICEKYGATGNKDYENEDFNVLNFERIKWGGIRYCDIIYCMFDLEQFTKYDNFSPTEEDIILFKNILQTIEGCDKKDGPTQLREKLKGVFPSTKDERDQVIEILAELGILKPKELRPIRGPRNDWSGAEDWRGEDGYEKSVVDLYFGNFIK